MSLADYFSACIVKCKHCAQRHNSFHWSKIFQLLHYWWLASVSFASRKNIAPCMTSTASIIAQLELFYCSVLSKFKVTGSRHSFVCRQTVKVMFAVWSRSQKIQQRFWPQLQMWLWHLCEWPSLVDHTVLWLISLEVDLIILTEQQLN